MRRHEDDFYGGIDADDALERFHSREGGHHEVEDHKLGAAAADDLESLNGIEQNYQLDIGLAGEGVRDELQEFGIVIDRNQEDFAGL
jgi:hypothetical protein